jgi:hypothetical protein
MAMAISMPEEPTMPEAPTTITVSPGLSLAFTKAP